MTELPEPPTPVEADLRGMPFMPFFGDRLFASTTWLRASFEGRCAALQLWWHAFAKEVPAGSLPDDESLLSVHAGYGIAAKKGFAKIRDEAMRGWFKATDGRLYHKVVAEIVADAWVDRQKYRDMRQKWRDKKQKQRGHSEKSPGENPNVPSVSLGTSLLSETERERDNPVVPENSGKAKKATNPRALGTNPRALGTNPRAHANGPQHVGNYTPEPATPPGMREASTAEYVEYMREKTGDPKLVHGDWRLSRWQRVPIKWASKAKGKTA